MVSHGLPPMCPRAYTRRASRTVRRCRPHGVPRLQPYFEQTDVQVRERLDVFTGRAARGTKRRARSKGKHESCDVTGWVLLRPLGFAAFRLTWASSVRRRSSSLARRSPLRREALPRPPSLPRARTAGAPRRPRIGGMPARRAADERLGAGGFGARQRRRRAASAPAAPAGPDPRQGRDGRRDLHRAPPRPRGTRRRAEGPDPPQPHAPRAPQRHDPLAAAPRARAPRSSSRTRCRAPSA